MCVPPAAVTLTAPSGFCLAASGVPIAMYHWSSKSTHIALADKSVAWLCHRCVQSEAHHSALALSCYGACYACPMVDLDD